MQNRLSDFKKVEGNYVYSSLDKRIHLVPATEATTKSTRKLNIYLYRVTNSAISC